MEHQDNVRGRENSASSSRDAQLQISSSRAQRRPDGCKQDKWDWATGELLLYSGHEKDSAAHTEGRGTYAVQRGTEGPDRWEAMDEDGLPRSKP